jgi:hypothetical protein
MEKEIVKVNMQLRVYADIFRTYASSSADDEVMSEFLLTHSWAMSEMVSTLESVLKKIDEKEIEKIKNGEKNEK